MGRPPIGKIAMTGAERVRRYRLKHRKEENHKPRQRPFKPTDTAKNIATILVGMFTPSKAEDIARAVLKMLKAKAAASRS
jgi:hypothetical protein